MVDTEVQVNFDAPAILRKWPSLNNRRHTEGGGPYLLLDGTLDECIREYIARPASTTSLRDSYRTTAPVGEHRPVWSNHR
jgi:hypothetical protein